MTNEATLQKMIEMKFSGMVQAFKNTLQSNFRPDMTADELVGYLVDAEWEERQNRRLTRLIKNATFRVQAAIEQVYTHPVREIDKNLLFRLADCSWIKRGENTLITGPTGAGKSFIACALGNQATHYNIKTLYFNTNKMFSKLKMAKADGSYVKELKKIQKHPLLILDDFGLHPLDELSNLILLEILEDRYSVGATIVTSQFPIGDWHQLISNSTVADAICDRLIHNAHKIELEGRLYEKIKKNLIPVENGHLRL